MRYVEGSSIGGHVQNKIPIAVNIVDSRNRRPKFEVARPRRGKGGLLARVGVVPFIGSNLLRGVGRVFQDVVLPIRFFIFDRFDLGVDENHRIAKAIELGL